MLKAATEIRDRLRLYDTYFVGGAVRDALLGREPGEIDIATSATPDQIREVFDHVIDIGKAFGVCLVKDFGTPVEVATFRTESAYRDGRHPSEIEYADSAVEDSKRRDFTINAIYESEGGELLDPQGGREDLRRKLVRTVGDPHERFTEDHIRMLRGVRFASQLGFHLDSPTASAIAANASKLADEPGERISAELTKILISGRASYGCDLMKRLGILDAVLPSLEGLSEVEQGAEFHPEGDVWTHTVMAMSHADALGVQDLETLLAILLHDTGKASTKAVRDGKITFYGHELVSADIAREDLRRLKYKTSIVDSVVWLIAHHMRLQSFPEMRAETARTLVQSADADRLLVLNICDRLAASGNLKEVKDAVRLLGELRRQPPDPAPLITGNDLIELGIPPGPELGRLMKEIQERSRQGDLATREDAMEWVRAHLNRKK